MCGLVGVIRGTDKFLLIQDTEEIFDTMLYADAVRGWDATGVFFAEKDGPVSYYKRNLPSYDFMYTRRYSSLRKKNWKFNTFIGHNRAASVGKLSDEMAHPFNFEHIIGVHNGTIQKHNSLTGHGIVHESDSEALFWAINEYGAEEVLPKVEGAFALIWYDRRTGNISIARNKERPLYIIKIKEKNSIVLASEHLMAQWAITRKGHKIESATTVEPGIIYTFDSANPTEWERQEVKLLEKKFYGQGGYGGYGDYWDEYQERYKEKYSTGGAVNDIHGKILSIEDLKLGNEAELYVSSIEHHKDDILKVTGWIESKLWPTAVCYIKRKNDVGIDIDSVEIADTITGKIKHIKREGDIGIKVVISAASHFEYEKEEEEGNILYLSGPDGATVSTSRWNELTKHGCALCQCDIKTNRDVAFWTTDSQPICPDHAKEELSGYGITKH